MIKKITCIHLLLSISCLMVNVYADSNDDATRNFLKLKYMLISRQFDELKELSMNQTELYMTAKKLTDDVQFVEDKDLNAQLISRLVNKEKEVASKDQLLKDARKKNRSWKIAAGVLGGSVIVTGTMFLGFILSLRP